jgi:uncharacterized damage-inducible protein DinB
MYAYLGRARRELWTALEQAPDTVLARPMLPGERFHCIKDLLFHVAAVEDGWLHEDILRVAPVLDTSEVLAQTTGGPEYAAVRLATLLDYWRAVEARMAAYLAALTEVERTRVVAVHDAPDERYTVDGLLWHVLLHEVRHTAQICMLLRMQGVAPPALDLLFFLPHA